MREAKVTIAESRGEVARRSEKIAELQNVVHRQGQRDVVDVGEHVDEEGDTDEVVQSIINNHQREEDRYWRSSLMVTAGTTGRTDYGKNAYSHLILKPCKIVKIERIEVIESPLKDSIEKIH